MSALDSAERPSRDPRPNNRLILLFFIRVRGSGPLDPLSISRRSDQTKTHPANSKLGQNNAKARGRAYPRSVAARFVSLAQFAFLVWLSFCSRLTSSDWPSSL